MCESLRLHGLPLLIDTLRQHVNIDYALNLSQHVVASRSLRLCRLLVHVAMNGGIQAMLRCGLLGARLLILEEWF